MSELSVLPNNSLAAPSNAIVMTSQVYPPEDERHPMDSILATALVDIQSNLGNFVSYRALLDSGSSLHFVSERLVQQLNLKRSRAYIDIAGIGSTSIGVKHKIRIVLKSRTTEYQTSFEAFVLPKITNDQPSRSIDPRSFKIPDNIVLADPHFYNPAPVDLLIGADLFFNLLAVGQIRLGPELPIMQKTVLGWVVAGGKRRLSTSCMVVVKKPEDTEEDLELLVKKFWEIEEFKTPLGLQKAEDECQRHFLEHVRRDDSGRFWVKLPFRKSTDLLGSSLHIAQKRFFNLENKLQKSTTLREQYSNFMSEYLNLGHM